MNILDRLGFGTYALFMSCFIKSRQSFVFAVLILGGVKILFGQQKMNDFTKRVQTFDGKLSSFSTRGSSLQKMSAFSSKRINLREWSSKYSSIGGKRFRNQSRHSWSQDRFKTINLPIELPLNDQRASENGKKISDHSITNREPAVNSVDFRDAYYAQLDKRVDDWMSKVNNMSLQDINRYQFRRDRPQEPGFPVQRAGAQAEFDSRRQTPLQGTGLPEKSNTKNFGLEGKYWMGPKTRKTSGSSLSSNGDSNPRSSSLLSTSSQNKKFKASSKPVLGPKTIRVEVGAAE